MSTTVLQKQLAGSEGIFKSYLDTLIVKGEIKGIQLLINGIAGIGMEEELSFKVFGTKGAIFLKNWRELWISKNGMNMEKLEIEEKNSLVGLLDNVFKARDGEESNIVDFYEGYKTHRVKEELLIEELD